MRLTAKNVNAVVLDCLYPFETATLPEGALVVEGIMRSYGFQPEKLEAHREDVKSMLSDLPDQFQQDKGGGWSFLAMCQTKNGTQWGEHPDMEALYCLAAGLGYAKFVLPRSMWSMFPGGMPYIAINLDGYHEATNGTAEPAK